MTYTDRKNMPTDEVMIAEVEFGMDWHLDSGHPEKVLATAEILIDILEQKVLRAISMSAEVAR